MPEIKSMVNTSSRYFHGLFYNIEYISNSPCEFLKLLLVFKKPMLKSG